MEEAGVDGLEDFVEIVVMADGCGESFASAGLANVLGLFGDGFGGDVAAIAVGVESRDWLLVELGEEDVGDCVVDGFGCGLEQVGEADVEAAFAQADGGVERGEAAEANVEWGNGSAGTQFAVLVLEDGDEGGGCGNFFCARLSRFYWLQRRYGSFMEESWGWRWGRGKELQKLTQRGWAGMLRCCQGVVLVAVSDFY
ncbi:MAG: hypothetical protein ABI286_05505 [Edaphobacter sp.]